jgi:hypothetical protein
MRVRALRRRSHASLRQILVVATLAGLAALDAACGATNLFRPYEYEEEVYLSLDGSATIYVNSSLAALNALRGTTFDLNSTSSADRNAVRQFFSSPITHVAPVRTSRRRGRRFVHIRLDVDDIRTLGAVKPFAWSAYRFDRVGDELVFEQDVGGAAGRPVPNVGWKGDELVAFRLHLPSRINEDNTGRGVGRGNILAWEQPLSDRLRGLPLTLQARIQTQSILARTLWLFGATFAAVATLFAAIIWWVLRRGKVPEHVI